MKENNGHNWNKALEQFMEIWIMPEIERRREKGQIPDNFTLEAAQVIWYPDGRERLILLNNEVKAQLIRGGIDSTRIQLSDDFNPNCGHITSFHISEDTWLLRFSAVYNRQFAEEHIKQANNFYAAAKYAFDHCIWAVFIDNLYSCVELLAKSLLLLSPDPKLKKARHKYVKSKFNLYTNLKNAPKTYSDTLNKLAVLRNKARYLQGKYTLSEDEAIKLLDVANDMINNALQRISPP